MEWDWKLDSKENKYIKLNFFHLFCKQVNFLEEFLRMSEHKIDLNLDLELAHAKNIICCLRIFPTGGSVFSLNMCFYCYYAIRFVILLR